MTLVSAQQRLDRLHQQSRIAAGSLIVSVFGDAVLPRGGGVWLGSLITLMQELGVNERLVRTTVFRLVKDDWLRTETQGRRANYHLTPIGLRRFDEAARHIYAAHAPAWDQRWRLLLLVGDVTPRHRDALRRAMRWQGFGELTPGCFMHPGADLSEAMNALAADGLGHLRPHLMPMVATQPDLQPAASNASLVTQAWDLAQLARGYAGFLADYQPLLKELDALGRGRQKKTLSPETAFRARSLMIHDFRRLLLQDPELPADLLPPQWPGQQAREVCGEIYARLLGTSEEYLDANLQLAGGEINAPGQALGQRFRAVNAPATARA